MFVAVGVILISAFSSSICKVYSFVEPIVPDVNAGKIVPLVTSSALRVVFWLFHVPPRSSP